MSEGYLWTLVSSEVVDPVGVAQKLPRISTIIVCWFSAEWLSEGMTRSKIPQSFITPYYPYSSDF